MKLFNDSCYFQLRLNFEIWFDEYDKFFLFINFLQKLKNGKIYATNVFLIND